MVLGRLTRGRHTDNPGGHHSIRTNQQSTSINRPIFMPDALPATALPIYPAWETTTQQQQPLYGPLSGTTRVSRYQKKHSPTHHPDHLIFISFFHLPRSTASSLFKLHASQSFCTTSLHVLFGYLLVWSPPPHIPYISSPSQCVLFATHAHTIATCFAVVSILYNLFLVFLSTPYLELSILYLNITHPSDHSHLCSLKCHLIFFPDRPGLTSV